MNWQSAGYDDDGIIHGSDEDGDIGLSDGEDHMRDDFGSLSPVDAPFPYFESSSLGEEESSKMDLQLANEEMNLFDGDQPDFSSDIQDSNHFSSPDVDNRNNGMMNDGNQQNFQVFDGSFTQPDKYEGRQKIFSAPPPPPPPVQQRIIMEETSPMNNQNIMNDERFIPQHTGLGNISNGIGNHDNRGYYHPPPFGYHSVNQSNPNIVNRPPPPPPQERQHQQRPNYLRHQQYSANQHNPFQHQQMIPKPSSFDRISRDEDLDDEDDANDRNETTMIDESEYIQSIRIKIERNRKSDVENRRLDPNEFKDKSIAEVLETLHEPFEDIVCLSSKNNIMVSELNPVLPSTQPTLFLVQERTDNKKDVWVVYEKELIQQIIKELGPKFPKFDFDNARIVIFVREVKLCRDQKKFKKEKKNKYYEEEVIRRKKKKKKRGNHDTNNRTQETKTKTRYFFLKYGNQLLQNKKTVYLELLKDAPHEKVFKLFTPHSNQNFQRINVGVKCPILEVTMVASDENYQLVSTFMLKYAAEKGRPKTESTTKTFIFPKDSSPYPRKIAQFLRNGMERDAGIFRQAQGDPNRARAGRPTVIRRFRPNKDYLFEEDCFCYDRWDDVHSPKRVTPVMVQNTNQGQRRNRRRSRKVPIDNNSGNVGVSKMMKIMKMNAQKLEQQKRKGKKKKKSQNTMIGPNEETRKKKKRKRGGGEASPSTHQTSFIEFERPSKRRRTD